MVKHLDYISTQRATDSNPTRSNRTFSSKPPVSLKDKTFFSSIFLKFGYLSVSPIQQSIEVCKGCRSLVFEPR